ncbi:MAG: hypothetical protein QXP60_05645 [Nitrososphaerota archaeon]
MKRISKILERIPGADVDLSAREVIIDLKTKLEIVKIDDDKVTYRLIGDKPNIIEDSCKLGELKEKIFSQLKYVF